MLKMAWFVDLSVQAHMPSKGKTLCSFGRSWDWNNENLKTAICSMTTAKIWSGLSCLVASKMFPQKKSHLEMSFIWKEIPCMLQLWKSWECSPPFSTEGGVSLPALPPQHLPLLKWLPICSVKSGTASLVLSIVLSAAVTKYIWGRKLRGLGDHVSVGTSLVSELKSIYILFQNLFCYIFKCVWPLPIVIWVPFPLAFTFGWPDVWVCLGQRDVSGCQNWASPPSPRDEVVTSLKV